MKIVKSFRDNDCTKNVVELNDGYHIEYCFKYPFWICVTTQVGCPVGCKFCYSGRMGYIRNLSVEEMRFQIENAISQSVKDKRSPFLTISFTGMGEPLLNIDNLIVLSNELMDNSNSTLSVTTTGIPSNMQKLFFLRRKISLDISVHSLRHDVRKKLIPFEKQYPILDTLDFVAKYKKRFKNITLDYMLLDDINDAEEDLYALIERMDGMDIAVELKIYNCHGSDDAFHQSTEEKFERFFRELKKRNIMVTVEKNVGLNIKAGCGQLVWDYIKGDK